MRLPENLLESASWAGVALVQVTIFTLLGLLAWLASRRGSPALRGAVLRATLVGLLVVPVLAALVPTWLPLPDCLCPAFSAAPLPQAAIPPPSPAPATEPATPLVLVTQPSLKSFLDVEITQQIGDMGPGKTRAEAVILELASPLDDTPTPAPTAEPARASWSGAEFLLGLWLLGALFCFLRALWALALLYRRARQARPIRDPEWTDCVATLAERHGLPAVALRESAGITSPMTLGLFRPVILLPTSRRSWSAEQREWILGHELAHIRRRDFLAGLLTELVLCLCWFHPLVRWLAGRLRLEQEFAADAWVASMLDDSIDYVRCLARLALEQGRERASLAPALWRRRPEILRRIDMLRRNPMGFPLHLGRRTTWALTALAVVLCLIVAGVGPLRSTAEAQPATEKSTEVKPTADAQGDPLPDGALARLGTTRLRHGADVTFVAFGPEGKTLITAGQDNTIRLWDLASRKEIRRFTRAKPPALKPPEGKDKPAPTEKDVAQAMMEIMGGAQNNSGSIRAAVAAGGKILAAGSGNSIHLWDVETGKELRSIDDVGGGLAGLVFSPDGRTLAGRTSNGSLYLWTVETGKQLHHIKPAKRPANNDGLVLTFGGRPAIAPGLAFTPDSKSLVAVATEYEKDQAIRYIKVWNAATAEEERKIKVPEGANVTALAAAPGGKYLAFGAGDAVHVCEADTGKEIRQLKPADGGVVAMVFALDGKTLAVRGRNQRVRLWETETGKELHQLNDAESPARYGGIAVLGGDFSGPEVRALAVSPDGKWVASAVGSSARIWDAATGKELPFPGGHWRAPFAVVLCSDGKSVVSWGFDRMIRRWEAGTGKLLDSFAAPARTTSAAFSPDGGTVALANADNTIRLHDTKTGKEVGRLKGHENGIAALAFSPDGKVLASRGSRDNAIRLHDVAKGAEVRQMVLRPRDTGGNDGIVLILGGGARSSRGTGPSLTFSPDGRMLIAPQSGSDEPGNTLVFLDAATGKELRKLESGQPIKSFAISADSRTLATENADGTIGLWEVASGKERGRLGKAVAKEPSATEQGLMRLAVAIEGVSGGFNEPGGPVGLSFSPDGRALAVRGPDLAVRVWDTSTGKEIGRFKGHTGRIETVSFAPNGKAVASGSGDTTVLLWDAPSVLKDLAPVRTIELPATEIETLWTDLAGADAMKARQAAQKLAAAPKQVVPFLGQHLKPVARVDAQKLAGWIADLESEKFAVRQEAIDNLLKTGEQAIPPLQKVLASAPPLETRKRVEELLDRLTGGTLTTEQLRLVRALEALEQIASPEAHQLLQTLADGAPGTLPTREAQAALSRMGDKR
jgi:WD40 repeat protein/beta-lactamase regulating signal transducer with metallopeptidase domain